MPLLKRAWAQFPVLAFGAAWLPSFDMSLMPQTNGDTFSGDKRFLKAGEIASHWRVSDRHVISLIEEGRLAAFDIAGRHDYVRVPMGGIKEIANRLNMQPNSLLIIINATKPMFLGSRRAFWRVLVVEGYNVFMRENHSRH